jgi:hypothetical protein
MISNFASRVFRFTFVAALVCGGAVFAAASMEPVPPVDWSQYTDTETLGVVTADEDGEARETTIWIAVVDGNAFIRTGGTKWGDNVERDPAIALRIDGTDIPVVVTFIEDEDLRESVVATFREKYGFMDGVIGIIRGSHPRIMQVERRP